MSQDYFATQSGSYTAEVTRRAAFAWAARTAANSPGIISGGLLSLADLQVSAPGSGMTVNISAGECLIGGTEGGSQGGYTMRNTATYSLPVAAANPSNPRIDAIVATMADAGYTQPSDVGATTNGPVFADVVGTPTSGATLANLTGAPAIPASSLLLAYLLVPATASNIITADIANKATAVVLGPGAPSVFATGMTFTPNTTTSYTTLGTSVTLVCTGQPVLVMAGPIDVQLTSAPAFNCFFGFSVDGGAATQACVVQINATGGQNTIQPITPMVVLSPTPGSHTFALQQKLDSGGAGCVFPTYQGQLIAFQI